MTVPDNAAAVHSEAFEECNALKSIFWRGKEYGGIEAFNEVFSESVTDFVADRAGESGGVYRDVSLKRAIIPGGVTSVGKGAFTDCCSLESITVPDSVNSVGDSAFFRCSGLKSITIPDSVVSIGEYSFFECSALESVTLPDSVKTIDVYLFRLPRP